MALRIPFTTSFTIKKRHSAWLGFPLHEVVAGPGEKSLKTGAIRIPVTNFFHNQEYTNGTQTMSSMQKKNDLYVSMQLQEVKMKTNNAKILVVLVAPRSRRSLDEQNEHGKETVKKGEVRSERSLGATPDNC